MSTCHRCFKDASASSQSFRFGLEGPIITTQLCRGCTFQVGQTLNFLRFEYERVIQSRISPNETLLAANQQTGEMRKVPKHDEEIGELQSETLAKEVRRRFEGRGFKRGKADDPSAPG